MGKNNSLLKAAVKSASRKNTPAASRNNSDNESDDEGSIFSDLSDETYLSVESDRDGLNEIDSETQDNDLTQIIKELLENILEKRASTREDALEKLVKIFTFKYVRDCLDNYHETTLERIKKAIIKGSTSKEKCLGAKLLELLFLTVEWNSESHFLEILPAMKKIIKDGKNNDVRASLVHTLAICCFVSDVDPTEVADLMSFYLQLATSSELPQNILLNILNSYGLLFTGLGYGGQSFMRKQFDDSIAFHVKCLDSPDPETRISTGENIAVMFETFGAHDEEREIYLDLPNLLDKLHAIANDSAKYRSKKERSHQRSAFRDIIPTVESGILPEIKLKFKRCNIYFDSWNKIKQLQNFRITLAGGFSVHIDRNELLHQIFGSSMISSQSNLGVPGSPRVVHSPKSRISKARTQKKSQSMLNRQAALSIGVEDDGDYL